MPKSLQISIVFSVLLSVGMSVMPLNAREVDPLFGDTIDRTAEDFVIASVCIADPTRWTDDMLGIAGHAFIRLQCPVFGLDNCFSYEGESVNDNLFNYLSGKTKMGYFAVHTDEYLVDYERWNRTVREYKLNLPPAVEQRLWEILDNHRATGLHHNLIKYGCATTVVKYIKMALDTVPITYAPCKYDELGSRQIAFNSMSNEPWLRLVIMPLVAYDSDVSRPIDEKLFIPADLAEVWQQATIDGQPMLTYQGNLVEGKELVEKAAWFTPMLFAILVLLVTIGFCFTRLAIWDWLLLAVQAVVGLILIALLFILKEIDLPVYILLLLFNPLSLLFWRWRKYWTPVYASFLFAGVVLLAVFSRFLVDPAVLVFALSYVVIYLKNYILSKR